MGERSVGAVLVTYNKRHFQPLHNEWQAAQLEHAGILLSHQLEFRQLLPRLERAARLLTPDSAHNQLMALDLFDTEDRGQAYVTSLAPSA